MRRSRSIYSDFIRREKKDEVGKSSKEEFRNWRGAPLIETLLSLLEIRRHKKSVAVILLLSFTWICLEWLQPLLLRHIVDGILLDSGRPKSLRTKTLNISGTALLVAIAFGQFASTTRDFQQRLLTARILTKLRRRVFAHLQTLAISKLSDLKTGGILSRLNGDVDATAGILQMGLLTPSIAVLRVTAAITILFWINWILALGVSGLVPGVLFASYLASKRIRPIHRSIRKDVESIDGRASEAFAGVRIVRSFRRDPSEVAAYVTGRNLITRKEMLAHRRDLTLLAGWGVMLGFVNVVIVWLGGWLYLHDRTSIGDIMAFQWYTFLLLNPLWMIANSFAELQRSLAAADRVFELLSWPADKPDREDCRDAPREVAEIRFENVSFAYCAGTLVLRDIDLMVPGNSVVALVGRSGAGKTTFTDLVARFHDPTIGRVLLNGIDLRDLRLRSLRGLLAIVPQETFLFDGSVRENVAYGRRHACDAQVVEACQRANAHEFVTKLPDGYSTLIGERGFKLSGGEKQRLAIARAILADPEILILDEATSNLDSESESLIQRALSELLRDRTTFIIAHRLSTVRRADVILVFENGEIIERGDHGALMASKGAYCAMVSRQLDRTDFC